MTADLLPWAARFGDASVSPLALVSGKCALGAASGDAFVAYAERGPWALVLGPPVGRPEAWDAALDRFLAHARARARRPVFLPVSGPQLGPFHARGLRAVRIGAEARLSLAGFTLHGSARKSARQSAARARREGCATRIAEPPHDAVTLSRLEAVSSRWLAARGRRERRFGTGTFAAARAARAVFAWVEDAGGVPAAFVTLHRAGDTVGVDLLRRRPDAPAGAMDLLVVRAAEWARDTGARGLHLGFTPLAGMGGARAPRGDRVACALGSLFRARYDCAGLERFKEKFRPEWRPAYAVGSDAPTIVGGTLAAAELLPFWR